MMNKPDLERELKLTQIKVWEFQHYSFLEIVLKYNAIFGTNHFSDLLQPKDKEEKK